MNVLTVKQLSISTARSVADGADTNQHNFLLDNINFTLNKGEILTIIGPNGAGKSSLLKAISGDLAYHGAISMPAIATQPTLRARQVAVLPQLSLLNFPYRVCEVVELARIPHETGHKIDLDIVDQALELMDIHALKNRLYPQLSGGEKQRVQLARVLAQLWQNNEASGPRLLILDEPTTALDLGHQQALMRAIQLFAKQGVAVLMVLHDINTAARFSNKLLALLDGRQIAFGDVDEVITHRNIEHLFATKIDILRHPLDNSPVIIGL